MTNTSGYPGTEQLGSTLTRPAWSASAPSHFGRRGGLDPGRPEDIPAADVFPLEDDALAMHLLDRVAGVDLDAQSLQLGLRRARQ